MPATLAEAPDRTTVRVTAITPRAEKAISRLSPAHQRLITRELQQPIPFARCKPVEALARFRMRRLDVSATLRVTLRRVDGGLVVCDAGTHPHADRFAELYDGELPSHLIPIEESTVMKNLVKPRPNGTAPTGPAQPAAPAAPSPRPVPPAVAGEAELLVSAVGLVVEKLVEEKKRQIDGDIVAMGELVRTQVEEVVRTQTGSLAATHERQRRAAEQAAEAVQAADALLRDELRKVGERLTAGLAAVRAEAEKDRAARAGAAARDREDLVARLDAALAAQREAGQGHERTAASLRSGLTAVEQQLAEHAGRLGRYGDAIDRNGQQAQAAAEQVPQLHAILENSQAVLADRLDRFEADLSRLGTQLAALRDSVERPGPQPVAAEPRWALSRLLKRLGLA